MCNLKIKQILLMFSGVFVFSIGVAQVPTYTIDSSFDTGVIFRDAGSVSDIHFLNDGRILVGGYFDNEFLGGMGMIYPNGQLDNSWEGNGYEFYNVLEIIAQDDGFVWPAVYGMSKVLLNGIPWHVAYNDSWSEYLSGGTFNPYNVQRVWDIYQMENGDLLLGGAIANDTLLPYELRGISRIHSDGSHDPTFPALNITPNHGAGAVHRIFRAPDGAWYISGGFTAINGHETNRVARLTADFEVDTTFVSPFVYDGFIASSANIRLVDSQSRVWVSGYEMRLQENPNDTIQIIRLLPNGEIDATFLARKLKNNYPDNWYPIPSLALYAQEVEAHPGNYFIYGSFSHFEDTLQPCITVVNDSGIIQNNFFQGQGATEYNINNQTYPNMPYITIIKQLSDGSLLIGGGFNEFMGETRYSMVKLKPDSITTSLLEIEKAVFKVFPNPANTYIEFEYKVLIPAKETVLRILDVQGKPIQTWNLGIDQEGIKVLDTRKLPNGVYFIELFQNSEKLKSGKFIIQH